MGSGACTGEHARCSPMRARGSMSSASSNLPLTAAAPIAPAAGRTLVSTANPTPAAMPRLASNLISDCSPAIRATTQRKTKAVTPGARTSPRLWALIKRIPPAAHVATLGCLAFISTAGAMYNPTREEPIVLAALQTSAPAPALETMAAVERKGAQPPGNPPTRLNQHQEEMPATEVTGDSQPPGADSEQTPEPPPSQTLLADSSALDGPIAPRTMPPGYDEGVMHDSTARRCE